MTEDTGQSASLPASLLDIAEALGLRIALRLMQDFGGQDLKFPKAPGPDHPIIKALGETDGQALCRHMGGAQIYVPHGRARRSVRSEVILLAEKGHDRTQIARLLGISQRHARRVATGSRDRRQPDLFD